MATPDEIRKAVLDVTDQGSLLHGLLADTLEWPIPETIEDLNKLAYSWTEDELRAQGLERHLLDGQVWQIHLRDGQPWGIFVVEFAHSHVFRTVLRQVLRGLVPSRRRPHNRPAWDHQNLLFICATRDYERVIFAHYRGDKTQTAKLATFGWQKGDPHLRTVCQFNLPALEWPDDGGRDDERWLKKWAKGFDKEPLTKDFFRRFDAAVDAVKADLEEHQEMSASEAYSRAQLLLERLLFLYFLQNRGWLDQRRDYLLHHFQAHKNRPNDFSYYAEFLEKLFWTLASAPGPANRLSGVPFLNGGLFEDDEFDPSPKRLKNNPPLKVRNATFASVFENLLEAFNFTVREDTPLDQDVAVDPEMLGKVFESIVLHAEAADPDAIAPDKRKATGSYYTPRIVVHFICREVLLQYLRRHLSGSNWDARLKALFELDAANGLHANDLQKLRSLLTPQEGTALRDRLRGLKCCDPAVGSGAFPVGLLHELLVLRRIAETAANGYVDPVRQPGTDWLHKVKEEIVQNCLFGVDIQQQAIEICRLRLWLTLVVDYDIGLDPFTADVSQFRAAIHRISQLPNLEMNFHRGDSLLDRISDVPVRIEPGALFFHKKKVNDIQELGRKLHQANKGERKRELRIEILRKRLDLTEGILQDQLAKFRDQDSAQNAWLFEGVGAHREKQRRLAEEIAKIEKAVAKVQADRKELEKLAQRRFDRDFYPKLRRLEGADFDSPFSFAWQLDFAGIFAPERGGFDIIVGNPPFVTARNPKKRELYRERWRRVCAGTFLLVSPFFELSFGILGTGGQLGFIVSNAFLTRDIGKPLIERFFPTIDLQKVIDCSGLSFPGHGTPTCLVFGSRQLPIPDSPIRVAGILPGGGDLRNSPEESLLWQTLASRHNEPGYEDSRIAVADRSRHELAKWPWNLDSAAEPTLKLLQQSEHSLADVSASYGSMFDTHKDDVFMLTPDRVRRHQVEMEGIAPVLIGDQIRNWQVAEPEYVLKPYDENWKLRKVNPSTRLFAYLELFRKELGSRATFQKTTYDEAGEPWYRYHQMSVSKISAAHSVVYPEIATHGHFHPQPGGILFTQTAPLVCLKDQREEANYLAAALLNSSSVLFWLKHACFNKGAGEDEERDRYEFAGGKVQRVPAPGPFLAFMKDEASPLALRLIPLAKGCAVRGWQLTSLALNKLFEAAAEGYQQENASLPGYVRPHAGLGTPFQDAKQLRQNYKNVLVLRDRLREEMVALQEEMDWLVYEAYGLIADPGPTLADADLSLTREQRPFCLWAQAGRDFAEAVKLIPADWSAARRALWRSRLETIRDNEHVRRIEQPVYKRRWDEQWKVKNRWVCGEPAYDAEFLEAFAWWLSEKAEWWLEHQKNSGPVALAEWTAALWSDPRIKAAWEVAEEVRYRLDRWKALQDEDSVAEASPANATQAAFGRFFKGLVKNQSVPEDIPYAVPWDQLEKRRRVPAAVKSLRGKLNVPRERFWTTADGQFRVARFS